VTTLIERMRQELIRRNYAATTIQSYLKAVEHFQKHVSSPLEAIGPDDMCRLKVSDIDSRRMMLRVAAGYRPLRHGGAGWSR